MRIAELVVIMVLSVSTLCGAEAAARDYRKVTDDVRLVRALRMLEQTNSTDIIEALYVQKKPVQVIFYDLGMISYQYKNNFATYAGDNFGEDYVIIHSRHRNAPREALAALIAHEVTHLRTSPDLDGEIEAVTAEAMQWAKALEQNSQLALNTDDLLIRRLNNILDIYRKDGREGIRDFVSANPFYDFLTQ